MRTRQSICERKARFVSEAEALATARNADILLLPYLCDRCRKFHLTSRTKGKGVLERDAKKWVPVFRTNLATTNTSFRIRFRGGAIAARLSQYNISGASGGSAR